MAAGAAGAAERVQVGPADVSRRLPREAGAPRRPPLPHLQASSLARRGRARGPRRGAPTPRRRLGFAALTERVRAFSLECADAAGFVSHIRAKTSCARLLTCLLACFLADLGVCLPARLPASARLPACQFLPARPPARPPARLLACVRACVPSCRLVMQPCVSALSLSWRCGCESCSQWRQHWRNFLIGRSSAQPAPASRSGIGGNILSAVLAPRVVTRARTRARKHANAV